MGTIRLHGAYDTQQLAGVLPVEEIVAGDIHWLVDCRDATFDFQASGVVDLAAGLAQLRVQSGCAVGEIKVVFWVADDFTFGMANILRGHGAIAELDILVTKEEHRAKEFLQD